MGLDFYGYCTPHITHPVRQVQVLGYGKPLFTILPTVFPRIKTSCMLTPIISPQYVIKNVLYFPVKYLRCQTQPKWQLEETVPQRGMLNVCKHMLCFCKGTSQIPADASSAEKYLAQVSSPRIYPVVGSGKMCHFQLFNSIGPMHK